MNPNCTERFTIYSWLCFILKLIHIERIPSASLQENKRAMKLPHSGAHRLGLLRLLLSLCPKLLHVVELLIWRRIEPSE